MPGNKREAIKLTFNRSFAVNDGSSTSVAQLGSSVSFSIPGGSAGAGEPEQVHTGGEEARALRLSTGRAG